MIYTATSEERNFIERIKAPIYLRQFVYDSQSNLKEKVNHSITKDDFYSRTDPSIFILIAPVSLDWSNKMS